MRARGQGRSGRRCKEPLETQNRHGRLGVVSVFIVGDDDELKLQIGGCIADLAPLELLIRDEHRCARVAKNIGRRAGRVDRVQRHRHERIGEHGLVEIDRFHAVGEQHRHAVAARESEPGPSVTPALDLFADKAERIIPPGFGLGVPSLVGDGIGALFKMVRQELGQRGEHVERLDVFAAAVIEIVGHMSGLVVCCAAVPSCTFRLCVGVAHERDEYEILDETRMCSQRRIICAVEVNIPRRRFSLNRFLWWRVNHTLKYVWSIAVP